MQYSTRSDEIQKERSSARKRKNRSGVGQNRINLTGMRYASQSTSIVLAVLFGALGDLTGLSLGTPFSLGTGPF